MFKSKILIILLCMLFLSTINKSYAAVIYITNDNNDMDYYINGSSGVVENSRLRPGDNNSDEEVQAIMGVNVEAFLGETIISATYWIRYANDDAGGRGAYGNPFDPFHIDLIDAGDCSPQDAANATGNEIGGYGDFYQLDFPNDSIGWVGIPCTAQVQYCIDNAKAWTASGNGFNNSEYWFQIRIRPDGITTDGDQQHCMISGAGSVASRLPYLQVEYGACASVSISSFTPSSTCIGNTVVINGSGFGLLSGTVSFNGTDAITFNSWATNQITVVVPVGTTTGEISVINSCGSNDITSGQDFTPLFMNISDFTPVTGCVGDTITINGSCFGFVQGTGTVDFNGTFVQAGDYVSWVESQILVMVPPGVSSGSIQVIEDSGGSVTSGANFVPGLPVISGFNPASACAGDTITITGFCFENVQGTGSVDFNGTLVAAGDYVSWTNTQILVRVPLGVSAGSIQVINDNGDSDTSAGTFSPGLPVISEFFPSTGCPGDTIIINGNCFGMVQGTVDFNGTFVQAPDYLNWVESQIQIIVPPGTTTGLIQIENDNTDTVLSASNFTVPIPIITGFTPGQGVPTDIVTIDGSGFGTETNIIEFWDDQPAASIISWLDNQIIAEVPAGATTGEISITNQCGNGAMSTGSNFTILSGVALSLSKSIVDITLDGAAISSIVPGCTITYNLYYSNQETVAANDMIIRDQLAPAVKYESMNPLGTWVEQYSLAGIPDQSYGSGDYANSPPAVGDKPNVTYIRWINPSVAAEEAGTLVYQVIVW